MPNEGGESGVRVVTAMVETERQPPILVVSVEFLHEGEVIDTLRFPGSACRLLRQALTKIIADYPAYVGDEVAPTEIRQFKMSGDPGKAGSN